MNRSRVRIKMCGMTRREDIEQAMYCGVDAFGLIFYPGSSRRVTVQQAKSLLCELPLFVDVVAVMVNPEWSFVNDIINELPVNYLQFHGNEPPDFCNQFNRPFIKSVSASSDQHINETMDLFPGASAILLDTPSQDFWGGTGRVFDWSLVPVSRTRPIILAGGLDADNVRTAVAATNPYAVDVCSGIEKSPGIKDHAQMIRFVNEVNSER